MPPLISSIGIPPRTLEGGVGVCRQLKVTARCHSTVQSHYTSRRLRSRSPSSHDGQMTIIPRSIVSPSLLISGIHVFLRFCSHLYLKKCQTILLVKASNYNIFKTFSNLMVINDCVLFSSFYFFWSCVCTELLIYSEGSVREGVCAGSQWALCVYDEGRGWKGDLGRQQVCFFSLRTSSRQAINRGDREKQWQSL